MKSHSNLVINNLRKIKLKKESFFVLSKNARYFRIFTNYSLIFLTICFYIYDPNLCWIKIIFIELNMTLCQNGLTHFDMNNKLDHFVFIANKVDF